MARKPSNNDYRHAKQEAVQRPEIGLESHVMKRDQTKLPDQTHHSNPSLANESSKDIDSSMPPELTWTEHPERDFAEFLIELAFKEAKGTKNVFPATWRWSKTRTERIENLADARSRLDTLSGAFLRWADKVDRRKVRIPTPPLFIHERHSVDAILNVMREKSTSPVINDLFGDDGLDISQRIDAYDHKGDWENRLILGDSLQVMNSLVVREQMGQQVQMIYFDPPYGVNFGSNFQPFVKETSVENNKDASMSREPEMVTAFRDTWELGLHSYLTYIRDRLMLAKEMLADSGSIFVQISDTNVHRIRQVMDEVFGQENFVSLVTFQTTSNATAKLMPTLCDYLIWYAKDIQNIHYNDIWREKPRDPGDLSATHVMLRDKSSRKVTPEEISGAEDLPEGSRLFSSGPLHSRGTKNQEEQPFEFEGEIYYPPPEKAGEQNIQRA